MDDWRKIAVVCSTGHDMLAGKSRSRRFGFADAGDGTYKYNNRGGTYKNGYIPFFLRLTMWATM